MLNRYVVVDRIVYRREGFGVRDWIRVIGRVFAVIGEKHLSLLAAGVAFFAMLALFPAITALISVFGYAADPVMVQNNLPMAETILPEQVYSLIERQITRLVSAEREALGLASIVGTGFALWSARAGIAAIMMGLSVISRDDSQRSLFWNLVVAYSLTVLLVLVTVVAIGSVVIIPAILTFFPLGPFADRIIDLARWIVAITAVAMGIGVLYRFGPTRRWRRTPMISVGSVVASLLWVLASAAFSVYLSRFANYNEVYGSLGAVIALLMWFYISAFVVLLGATLNAEIEGRAVFKIRERDPPKIRAGFRTA